MSRAQRLFTILLFAMLSVSALPRAAAQDGIPDNCEWPGEFQQPTWFPRYEAYSGRLVLVDWNTGGDVQVIATDLPDTRIQGWSADCRYLATAVGPAESMATVVWDVVDNRRMGEVPDAYLRPHPITWGPFNYLVVETRNGAILWNVPANTQVMLTESFDPVSGRNFRRLRWDVNAMQLIANLAVGGRVIYDLRTGEEVPLAANQTETYVPPRITDSIVVGGGRYACYENGPRDVYVDYEAGNGTLSLMLRNEGPDETLQVIEAGLLISSFRLRGWSPGCRYFAASLGLLNRAATDTIVWDIVENRRVGVFPDARQMAHPLFWAPTGTDILIQTRDGAYLWHLLDDRRVLINPNVETALAGRGGIRSFIEFEWDAERSQLIGIPVGAANQVVAFDIVSAQLVATYQISGTDAAVDYALSSDGAWIALYVPQSPLVTLWNRRTGAEMALAVESDATETQRPSLSTPFFSTDSQLLVIRYYRPQFSDVWELSNLQPGGTANRREDYLIPWRTGASPLTQDQGVLPVTPIDGVSGFSVASGTSPYGVRMPACGTLFADYERDTRQLVVRDARTGELIRVVEANLNQTERVIWSPNCRFLIGDVGLISDGPMPYDDNPLDDTDREWDTETIVVWDIESGARVAEMYNPFRLDSFWWVHWSPAGERAVVRTTDGFFLIHPEAATQTLLVFDGDVDSDFNTYLRVYWDYDRGQIITTGWRGAYAFDMETGQQRCLFSTGSGCGRGGCWFSLSDDGTTVFVAGYDYTSGTGVWNLDTLVYSQVYVGTRRPMLEDRIALGPDGRYLVMAYGALRVWDLDNLAEDVTDRLPVFRWPGPRTWIQSVRFIDNVTVETESARGVQRWNIETGAEVPVE